MEERLQGKGGNGSRMVEGARLQPGGGGKHRQAGVKGVKAAAVVSRQMLHTMYHVFLPTLVDV